MDSGKLSIQSWQIWPRQRPSLELCHWASKQPQVAGEECLHCSWKETCSRQVFGGWLQRPLCCSKSGSCGACTKTPSGRIRGCTCRRKHASVHSGFDLFCLASKVMWVLRISCINLNWEQIGNTHMRSYNLEASNLFDHWNKCISIMSQWMTCNTAAFWEFSSDCFSRSEVSYGVDIQSNLSCCSRNRA